MKNTSSNFFTRMNTRSRLYLFGTISFLLIIVVGVVGVRGISNSEQAARLAHEERLVPLTSLSQMMELLMDGRIQLLNAVRDGSPEGMSRRANRVENHLQTMQSLWSEIRPTMRGEVGAEVARQFDQTLNNYARNGAMPVVTALRAGDAQGANQHLSTTLYELYRPVRDEIRSMVTQTRELSQLEYEQGVAEGLLMRNMTLGTILFSVALGIFLLYRLSSRITRTLNAVEQASRKVASGDLTQRVKVYGEDDLASVSRNFNAMVDGMASMLRTLTHSVESLINTSDNLSQATIQTREAITRQQLETDQAATAMNQMTATVQEVAQSAAKATGATEQVNTHVGSGNQVVAAAAKGINTMADQIRDVSQAITRLGADSEQIGNVVEVIRGIAEQTNLLALNAAIEAARAGEQGRGFAVVADEVRTLAGRTQNSTSEIENMISQLQTGVKQTTEAISRSLGHSDDNVKHADEAAKSLNAITSAVRIMTDMNTQIASAAEQQGTTAEEINRTVTSIAQEAHHTAEGAEAMAHASEQLSHLAEELNSAIARFQLDEYTTHQPRESKPRQRSHAVQPAYATS